MTLDFTKHIPGIRPLLTPDSYNSLNWVHRDMTWPRSLTGWRTLLQTLRAPIFSGEQTTFAEIPVPPYNTNAIPDPWFHRAEAAAELEAFFHRNQALRYQMRRLFLAWSVKKMGQRVVGDTDVGTLEAIPVQSLVRIYDWKSRAIYQFHSHTIYRQVVGSLRYQYMAISSPKAPKNPYTNLPWSIGQLLCIYDQVCPILWKQARRFMDPAAQAFYRSHLCLTAFRTVFQHQLDIDCAHQFFHDPTSDYWDEMYRETLVDLFELLRPQQSYVLRSFIIDRSLPKTLLASWDTLLYGFWCYENLDRMVLPSVASSMDLFERATHLIRVTMEHVQRRRIVKKKEPPT